MKKRRIQKIVHESYWIHDINCAGTTLTALSCLCNHPLNKQVLHASLGMHGAGGFRAQCGLVEGSLMFIGILGAARGDSAETIAENCFTFAKEFTERFGSLSCRDLRPGGFSPDDAPHLCEKITAEAVFFTHQFIERVILKAIDHSETKSHDCSRANIVQ